MIIGLALNGGWLIFTMIIIFILGIIAGTFLTRFTLKGYFQKNPPISEEMISNMLRSMGQPANQKRVKQIMNQMKNGGNKK